MITTPSVGLKLILHPSAQYPLATNEGIAIPTNTDTKIAMEKVGLLRQPEPFSSKCRSTWPKSLKLPHKELPYHEGLCQSFLADDEFLNSCNCSVANMLEIDRKLERICNIALDTKGS